MKAMFEVTRKEISYGIRSSRFWGAMIALTILMWMDAELLIRGSTYTNTMGEVICDTDILSLMFTITGGGCYMFWVRFCLFAVPFGCCFYDEYSWGNSKYRLVRSGKKLYGASKMVAGTLLTATVVIASCLLLSMILRCRGIPFLLPEEFEEVDGMWISVSPIYYMFFLVDSGYPILFYILLMLHASLSGVFFSSMSIMLSAYIRHKYIILAMPLVLFFSVDSFFKLFFSADVDPPVWLDWQTMFFSMTEEEQQTELFGMLRTLLYTMAGVTIFTRLFIHKIPEVSESE